MPFHRPSVVSKVRSLASQAGSQSAGQPISDCRLPATVTLGTSGTGATRLTVRTSLTTRVPSGSLRMARYWMVVPTGTSDRSS